MALLRIAGVLLVFAVIGGCAAARTAEAQTRNITFIRFSAGPCFGACPVYSVEVTPTGPVRFEGKHFTRLSGVHMLPPDPTLFTSLRRTIERNEAGLTPENLTPESKGCAPVATDHPSYHMMWRRNGRDYTRTFYSGCHGPAAAPYRRLVKDFQSALARVDIPGAIDPDNAPPPQP